MAAKKKNVFALSGSVLFLFLIAVGIFVYLNFGDLTRRTIEKIATHAMGVDVRIAALDISIADKEAKVTGLTIANPPGYQTKHAVRVEAISVALDTVSKELVTFKDITVTGTDVNLEVTQNGTNLTDLKNGISTKKSDPEPDNAGSGIKVIIDALTIEPSTLNPSVTLLSRETANIKVPAVHLQGIGRRENGILAREAIVQVLTQYLNIAQKQAGSAGLLEGIAGQPKDLMDKAGEDVKELGKDIKGLFGN